MENANKKQLKEKIIQLIHQELDNVDENKIFYFNDYKLLLFDNHLAMNPIVSKSVVLKSNVDEEEKENLELMNYRLKFDDGEPDITISSIYNYTSKDVFYKPAGNWIVKKKLFTTHFKYTIITKISCGHVSFNLTEGEHNLLLEKTKLSYKKNSSLKANIEDKKIIEKINMRLK